jgi:hypothetical protein
MLDPATEQLRTAIDAGDLNQDEIETIYKLVAQSSLGRCKGG